MKARRSRISFHPRPAHEIPSEWGAGDGDEDGADRGEVSTHRDDRANHEREVRLEDDVERAPEAHMQLRVGVPLHILSFPVPVPVPSPTRARTPISP